MALWDSLKGAVSGVGNYLGGFAGTDTGKAITELGGAYLVADLNKNSPAPAASAPVSTPLPSWLLPVVIGAFALLLMVLLIPTKRS